MKAHQDAALFGNVAHRETGAVTIAPKFAHDGRKNAFGRHLADVPQRVGQNGLLEVDLGAGIEMLHHTSAACTRPDAAVGAGRFDTQFGCREDLLDNADLIARLVADLLVCDSFARQSALNEHDLAVAPGNASAFGIKFFHLCFEHGTNFFLAGTHFWGFLLCGVSN